MTPHPPFTPMRVTYRRELAAIERRLAADAPDLAAKLAMFSELGGGEAPAGAERVPPPAWARRGWTRPRMVYLAVLLVLAAIVTLCVYPSGHGRPAIRPCQAAASAYAGARGLACNAYANTKQ